MEKKKKQPPPRLDADVGFFPWGEITYPGSTLITDEQLDELSQEEVDRLFYDCLWSKECLLKTGYLYVSDGSIRHVLDADEEEVAIEPLRTELGDVEKAYHAAHSKAEDAIFGRLAGRHYLLMPHAEFDEIDGLREVCKKLVSLFIKAEVARIGRIHKYKIKEKIDEKIDKMSQTGFPADIEYQLPDYQEFTDHLLYTSSFFFERELSQRIFLAVNQLTLEAHALSKERKIPKAFNKELRARVDHFLYDRIKGLLADGRGAEPGAKRFDREEFLSRVKAEILKAKNEGHSARDITAKMVAANLNLGDITKGTGVSVLRKRLRVCGVGEAWGAFVDRVIKEASQPKRKSKKSKSKFRQPEN